MKEAIKTSVIPSHNPEKDSELEIEYFPQEDEVRLYLDGEEFCVMNYSTNAKLLFERALEIWKVTEP
jgi:hypothetical protein